MKLVSSKLNIITIILMLILVSIIVYLAVSSQVKKFKYESTGLVVIIMIIAVIYLQKTNKSKEGFESSPSFDFVLGGEELSLNNLASNSSVSDSVPIGSIIVWSGEPSNIPNGWSICDGTNGTPDLRNKFVLGSSDQKPMGTTGGAETHTLSIEEMPAHTHGYQYANSTPAIVGGSGLVINHIGTYTNRSTGYTGGDTEDKSRSTKPHNNMPPFYTLYYIMKVKNVSSGVSNLPNVGYAIVNYEKPHKEGPKFFGEAIHTYPINAVKYNGINLTLNKDNNEISLKKGDYIVDGYFSIRTEHRDRYCKLKMFIELMSSKSKILVGPNNYWQTRNGQTDFIMTDIVPFKGYFNLESDDIIRLAVDVLTDEGVYMGNEHDYLKSTLKLPEVYGSFKFTKLS